MALTKKIKEFLFDISIIRFFVAIIMFIRGAIFLKINLFLGLNDLCWICRVANISILKKITEPIIFNHLKSIKTNNAALISSYRKTKISKKIKSRYTLCGPGTQDIFRDIFVIKSATDNEKGVLIFNYGETYLAFFSFFRCETILKRYHVVLEMSWSGSCDPAYFLFINNYNAVVVQTPEIADANFINKVDSNLVCVNLGSGDWTDLDRFNSIENPIKEYDLIMVANWGKVKKHAELFKALKKMKTKDMLKVVLIGFPWHNRQAKHIINEFHSILGKKNAANVQLIVKENIPHAEVKYYLCRSKCSLLLSKKEGFNKGIMESFFCDTPAIIYDKHMGGAQEKINNNTGVLSSYSKLHKAIQNMLKNYKNYSPRAFVMQCSGSKYSTRTLNSKLQDVVTQKKENWTIDIVEKVNNPNFEYKNESDKSKFLDDYNYIKQNLI